MDAWGSYRSLVRAALVLIGAIALVAITIGACVGGQTNGARTAVQNFAQLLDKRDAAGAAALTSYPSDAQATMSELFAGLAPGVGTYRMSQLINLNAEDAFFTVDAAWHFGPGRDWAYSAQGSVVKLSVGWRISWNPEILMPGLGQGRMARLVRTYAPSPRVDLVGGAPLMTEQPVNAVDLDPSRTPNVNASAAAIAAVLAPVAPLITADTIRQQLAGSHGNPVTAVLLRDDTYAEIAPSLSGIPGLVVTQEPKLVTWDRRIDSPVLDALHGLWQASRDATSGWAVRIFDPDGAAIGQLVGYQGPAGPDITATLDPQLQLAAEDAVVSAGTAASIVAIAPSTGAVLAVAQNDQADAAGPVALTGMYPVGDTLDLFAAGAAATKNVAPDAVSPPDVTDLLRRVGIGTNPHVPGLTAITGRLSGGHVEPVRRDGSDQAQVSTYGMALAAAAIDRGSLMAPEIAVPVSGAQARPSTPLPAAALARMRELMRQSAANPEYAEHLAPYPGLIGYTGYADADQWFVGYRGDVAFAIHIADTTSDGGDAAARMAAWMFGSVEHPED